MNFQCPKCGSHNFTTPGRTDGPVEEWERWCRGVDYSTSDYCCDFKWLGKDDYKYGLGCKRADIEQCRVPPGGWHCTRHAGHSGPCAAVPNDPPIGEGTTTLDMWMHRAQKAEALLAAAYAFGFHGSKHWYVLEWGGGWVTAPNDDGFNCSKPYGSRGEAVAEAKRLAGL